MPVHICVCLGPARSCIIVMKFYKSFLLNKSIASLIRYMAPNIATSVTFYWHVPMFIYCMLWCNHTNGINVCVCFLHPCFSEACFIIDGYLPLNCTCACLWGSLYGMGNVTYWVLIMQDKLHMNNCQTGSVCFNSSTPGQNGCHFTKYIFICIFVDEKFRTLIKSFSENCIILNNFP